MIRHSIDIVFLLTILLVGCGSSNSVHYPAPVYPGNEHFVNNCPVDGSLADQCIQFTFPQTGGVYGTLHQMQQVQAADHFDTMRFCERFMIDPIGGNFPNSMSFAHTKSMIRQHLAVMRCVIFSEMMALPHNIFQDFRRYGRHVTPIKFHSVNFDLNFFRSITRIKREGVLGVKELIVLPFKLVLTVSSAPFRILKAFLRLTSIFIKAHKEIYFNYG